MKQDAALRAVRGSPPKAPPWSRWHLVAAVQVVDAIAVLSAAVLSRFIVWHSTDLEPPTIKSSSITALEMAFIAHCVFRSLGAYDYSVIVRACPSGSAAVAAWIFVISPLLVLVASWYPKDNGTWDWIITWFVCTALLIVLVRGISARASVALVRSRRIGHTMCIVGSGNEARSCTSWAQQYSNDFIILGYFESGDNGPKTLINAACLGSLADLPKFILQHRVDELIVAVPGRRCKAMGDLISYLRCLPVCLSIWPESINLSTDWKVAADGRGGNMPLLRVSRAPLDGWLWLLKDVQDRAIALIVLILCLPVLLAITLGIRLTSPGPVFFRQVREGYCGREFRIFKFRTMHAKEVSSPPDRFFLLATKADPRCFPFGALLRKTSLDELPQLLNVLAGDMWLVGPRPHSPLATAAGRLYSDAVPQYPARHRIKPGITGWAQVNGWRGPTTTFEQIRERVVHDLYYIENWSPLLDWQILIKTALFGFAHQNAF